MRIDGQRERCITEEWMPTIAKNDLQEAADAAVQVAAHLQRTCQREDEDRRVEPQHRRPGVCEICAGSADQLSSMRHGHEMSDVALTGSSVNG